MNEKFRKYTSDETFERIVDFQNVTEMWNRCISEYADSIAIVDGENYTYAKLDEDAAYFRTVLKENNADTGSLIGILCPNSYGFVKAFLAATTLGVAAVLPTVL